RPAGLGRCSATYRRIAALGSVTLLALGAVFGHRDAARGSLQLHAGPKVTAQLIGSLPDVGRWLRLRGRGRRPCHRVVSYLPSGQLQLTTRAGTDHWRTELTTRGRGSPARPGELSRTSCAGPPADRRCGCPARPRSRPAGSARCPPSAERRPAASPTPSAPAERSRRPN